LPNFLAFSWLPLLGQSVHLVTMPNSSFHGIHYAVSSVKLLNNSMGIQQHAPLAPRPECTDPCALSASTSASVSGPRTPSSKPGPFYGHVRVCCLLSWPSDAHKQATQVGHCQRSIRGWELNGMATGTWPRDEWADLMCWAWLCIYSCVKF